MGAILHWLTQNWFPLLQTVGIVGGLAFTGLSIRQATAARKATDLLAITEQHRQLWVPAYTQPGLTRILATEVDLVEKPITTVEERFLNELVIHFYTGWRLAGKGSLLTLEAMRADARTFLNYPLPRAVWEQTKKFRDERFVQFIESCAMDGAKRKADER